MGTDSWTFAKKKKLQNDKDLLPGFTDLGMEESHQIIKKNIKPISLGEFIKECFVDCAVLAYPE